MTSHRASRAGNVILTCAWSVDWARLRLELSIFGTFQRRLDANLELLAWKRAWFGVLACM